MVAPDRPGFGDADKPAGLALVTGCAPHLNGILDQLGIERAHLGATTSVVPRQKLTLSVDGDA